MRRVERIVVVVAALLAACSSHSPSGATDAAGVVDTAMPPADGSGPSAGSAGTVGHYEAEAMTLGGGATVVGTADGRDRTEGDLGGEASARQAVTLAGSGDALTFTVLPAHAGASGFVIRYSIPDAGSGGGQATALAIAATNPDGSVVAQTLTLTSRYAWLYGGEVANTKLYNTPANALQFAKSNAPAHLYDEMQVILPHALDAGATVTLALGNAAAGIPVTVDFVELEILAPPLAPPADLLSITAGSCGATALDTNATGRAFDGVDDTGYASVFDAVIGTNPFNPTSGSGVQSAGTQEKDYYRSGSADARQDATMFALADHNFQSVKACLAAVAASSGVYTGLWIPPGRFYLRGSLAVPDGVAIRGAGMWYAKLVAVDTEPPVAAMDMANGQSGIASVSGDFRFTGSGSAGSTGVTLSDFSMFGNVTQRDVVDNPVPIAVIGAFSNSAFSNLWIEHYSQAVVIDGASTGDTITAIRARDTFADGIDLFGDTSHTQIANCQSRSNGDDGVAVWSQSATTVSTGNSVSHCEARLQWRGDGLAAYGGSGVTISDSLAADTLDGAGLKLATEFVATDLPDTFTMTATVSNVELDRCGGNTIQQFGALLTGAELEDVSSITLDHLTIDSPTFAAFDVRFLSNAGAVTPRGVVDGLVVTNARVLDDGDGATCAHVGSGETGRASFDACECPAATACTVDNLSPATFAIGADTCTAACN